MSFKFSIVIPTRHRPEFIKESLRYISYQSYKNFELIVCDNFADPELSCSRQFQEAGIAELIYLKPEMELGMVENWNYALSKASGDYVLYLTDKMFLLPDTLYKLNEALSLYKADIASWVDDFYTPINNTDYFGAGFYYRSETKVPVDLKFIKYDPKKELSIKAQADVSREQQTRSTYSRGKICFGAYSRDLIEKIVSRNSHLFHDISPDYTSMILALETANTAIELKDPGIVHINTNISNGGLAAVRDDFALNFVLALKDSEDIMQQLLIKGLYASQHNMVSHDYLLLKKKYNLEFEFNSTNWLLHIYNDLYLKPRRWSSIYAEHQQKGLFIDYINSLPSYQAEFIKQRIVELNDGEDSRNHQENADKNKIESVTTGLRLKDIIRMLMPYGIINRHRRFQRRKLCYNEGLSNSLFEAVQINNF